MLGELDRLEMAGRFEGVAVLGRQEEEVVVQEGQMVVAGRLVVQKRRGLLVHLDAVV